VFDARISFTAAFFGLKTGQLIWFNCGMFTDIPQAIITGLTERKK
jgi:hypothetical protein